MKRIWIAISTLIVVVGLCIGEIIWVSNIAENIESQISEIEETVSIGNLENAISFAEQISSQWNKSHNKLAIFVDHKSLEDIDQSMEIMEVSLSTLNLYQFYIETSKIKSSINDLVDTETPSIYNIL